MITASTVAILLGVLVLLDNLFLLTKPDLVREALMAYPRMKLPAQVLTAVCLVWFARNLWMVDFGGFSVLKNLLFIAVPVGWYLIVTFIPDLLAVRALCCLLLLAGNPVLVAVRWQGFPSWVLGILIYAVMIYAMVFAVYPHLWKRGVHWMFASPQRVRSLAALGLSVSALLILSGLMG
jgi:hypothetical protein